MSRQRQTPRGGGRGGLPTRRMRTRIRMRLVETPPRPLVTGEDPSHSVEYIRLGRSSGLRLTIGTGNEDWSPTIESRSSCGFLLLSFSEQKDFSYSPWAARFFILLLLGLRKLGRGLGASRISGLQHIYSNLSCWKAVDFQSGSSALERAPIPGLHKFGSPALQSTPSMPC